MNYNFDEIINRKNTNSEKWDNCEERFGKSDLLPLWVADMDFRTPDFIINALKKRLEHEIIGYAIRPESFYNSIRNWLKVKGWEIDTEKIVFTPGVLAAINAAVNIFTKPNDKILILTPVYHPFMYAIDNNNRKTVKSSLINDNGYYTIDYDDVESKLATGVKMLIFCNPHNPVGRVWNINELKKIGELCLKYNVLIVSDEIHSDLIFEPNKHTYFASVSDDIAKNTITLLSPSKTFNIAGVFSSIAYSDNDDLIGKLRKYTDIMHISQGTIFGDIAFEAAYTYGHDWLKQVIKYIDSNFDFIINYLQANIPQIRTQKPEGTYLMWLDCSNMSMSADELNDFMVNKANIALNPGIIFGKEGEFFMRLNAATPRLNLQNALENIKYALN